MSDRMTRREALQRMSSAGAGLTLAGIPALRPSAIWRGGAQVAGRDVEVAVSEVSPATLRLTVLPAGTTDADQVTHDGALVDPSFAPQRRMRPPGGTTTVGDFAVTVDNDPLTVRISRGDNDTAASWPIALEVDPDSGALSFPLGDRPLLGLGEGGPQFDRRGESYRMRSGQGGYQLRTHGGVVPIQWLLSTEGWALYIHQPLGTFDLSGARGRFDPPEEGPPLPLDVFLVAADEPAEIMGEWARLTGHPELPPLWSFGYLQSHRTLSGPEEVMWVAETFREKELPCDALIYLGTGFTPSGWNTNNGEFAWNPEVFPEPEAMIERLHEMHFKVVVHVVLEGRRLTGTVHDPCPDPPGPGETGSGRDWPDEQQVGCYWPIHREVFEQGVDGWWPDQGDGLDAESRLARNRMYWEGQQMWAPDQRVFALHRNGYAGMSRYASFLWSGDVYTTWETLATHVPDAVNTGLSGITYWGTDIGGFVPTPEYTGELHLRWFQFGAFCPLFRAHGRTWHLRLPWGWNTGELGHDEIANYRGGAGNPDLAELSNPEVEPICRQYLELRYRLLPYLYTAVRDGHDTGLPIMRSLWLHYPDDDIAAATGDQFLWGRDILVAPVVEQGATTRSVYLPAGRWHDFWTEAVTDGGRTVSRTVDLATTPLYVRAGAIIPFGPVKQYTSEPSDEPIELVIYPGADGAASLYEDDGASLGYQRGDWMRILMSWSESTGMLTMRLADGSQPRAPMPRTFRVRVAPSQETREITFDGRALEIRL
ncbi:MAG: glycoside hydrolase family 31 protein [Acidobacteriota bacterium]|jgi:alpha-glucosidase/alpha-D-xyloside xylohydrolase